MDLVPHVESIDQNNKVTNVPQKNQNIARWIEAVWLLHLVDLSYQMSSVCIFQMTIKERKGGI